MNLPADDISHIIQLAVAPVFLLTGVSTKLVVLTNRLARIIDRLRVLEERLVLMPHHSDTEIADEMQVLYLRRAWINRAITQSTLCGLLICLVVAALFLGAAFGLNLGSMIVAMFVLAMLLLIGSFMCFLREIFISGYSSTPTILPKPRHPH